MNVVKGTIENWNSLDDLRETFQKKGFSDIKTEKNSLLISINESREFLKIIVADGNINRYFNSLDEQGLEYILLIRNFQEFIFAKKKLTTLGKERITKFKFSKTHARGSTIKKLNELSFNNTGSFENLFDTKSVVEEFYVEYKKKREKLTEAIQNMPNQIDKDQYAQIIFDRLIFLHFIQEKGFLNSDKTFMLDEFELIKKNKKNYYLDFLRFLFFDVLNKPKKDRKTLNHSEFNTIEYLNGGLFREHRIELENPDIWIENNVFEDILYFLKNWYWYIDENSETGEDNALSPEILGHIFEKTVTGQKSKGAYYTPETITTYLSESTIFPYCLEKINKEFKTAYSSINQIFENPKPKEICYLYFNVIKKLSILDNACGSGAFLLAAQKTLLELYRKSLQVLRNNKASDKRIDRELEEVSKHKSEDYHIKKTVITNNLYGVDIEEGAIEICKLRLWLSLVSDIDTQNIEPLPNIDYNIVCGNSIIGYIQRPKIEYMNIISSGLYPLSSEDIIRKMIELKSQFASEDNPIRVKKLKEEIDAKYLDFTQDLSNNLFTNLVQGKIVIKKELFETLKPFHWGLAFPSIIENGGFDIIISNPPWDILKPSEKEFFSQYDSKLTKYGIDKIETKKIISKLLNDKKIKKKWDEHVELFRFHSAYFKNSKYFQHQSGEIDGDTVGGDLNLYKLFTEQSYNLLKEGGYCGIVIPSGFYTDAGTKGLRELIFDKTKVDALVCFENTNGIFDGIHRSFKFIVLNFKKGEETKTFKAMFMKRAPDVLKEIDTKGVVIDWSLIKKLSPNAYSILEFKGKKDIEIIKKLYRYPLLGEEIGDWKFILFSELHMTLDSSLFKTKINNVILYEGKMIEQYRCDFEKPRYWVDENDAIEKFGKNYLDYKEYRLGFRAVASSTNKRSMIATILPKRVFCGNSLLITKRYEDGRLIIDDSDLVYLCALLNSFTLDYILRQKVTTNLNMFFIYELPIPRIPKTNKQYKKLVELAGSLICTSKSFSDLKERLDIKEVFTESQERLKIQAKIEIIVSKLYGLNPTELEHILGQFVPKKKESLQELEQLKKEIEKQLQYEAV